MLEFIYSEVENTIKKYGTRDPYELLDAIGADTIMSYAYRRDGLKGYSTIMHRRMYAVINGKLCEDEMRIVAGHEASHLIIHRDQILASASKMMKDFNIYDDSGRHEREANAFLADFLVSDKEVLDVAADTEHDFLSASFELRMPPQLFAFKVYNMIRRGHNLRNPIDLDSRFLGAKKNQWQL